MSRLSLASRTRRVSSSLSASRMRSRSAWGMRSSFSKYVCPLLSIVLVLGRDGKGDPDLRNLLLPFVQHIGDELRQGAKPSYALRRDGPLRGRHGRHAFHNGVGRVLKPALDAALRMSAGTITTIAEVLLRVNRLLVVTEWDQDAFKAVH